MPLNGEEKYRQENFNEILAREQVRLANQEQEIALLEGELNLTRNRLDRSDRYIDKLVKQRDRVNGAINLHKRGRRSEGITLDDICMIMRHPL